MATRAAKKPAKMKLYRWNWAGKGPNGRKVRGQLIAAKKGEVEKTLAGQNVVVSSIRRKGGLGGAGKIKPRDIMLFARQMATMIRAGVPVLQAFEVVAESLEKPAMSALVQELMNEVAAGASFSEALRQHPDYFDQLFVNLIAAGEQSGSLDSMLERVATYKEKIESLKARVKKALWYPAAVISVGLGVTALLLIKVVPQFESLFAGFGAELPAMTRMTIAMSEFAQAYWWWGVLGVMGFITFIRQGMKRSETFAYRMHAFALKVPVLGDILDKSSVARYSRTLATTFGAGVPLIEALNTAGAASGNKVYERAIEQVGEDVSSGQQLNFAMRLTERFPALAVQMVGIGEESGALDAMLNRVADYYEEQVDNKVDALTSLLEPLIIVVLGVMVGGLVVSMYMPIFQLGSVL
ncbi:type II secretion system F family protein [Halomonas sp. TRM85114]|uniref:type II secretion system F family protein n=1 Tax=Halomonas jincaotanensis TaxID=2810616 RepID=UPI001BD6B867|nr:type II secretion system F family protein [Halomonas jincaotanensis]MBS9402421.1 type II secretion system F family protein [Halomonas jincaotanensis]